VSMGTNVLSVGAVRKHLERGERVDMPELIERFRSAGRRVAVRVPDAYWLDLGRLEDLETGTRIYSEDPGRFLGG
ncbi:MAG: nucleotidyltransferase family protein, partial [Acidimicrobiia bacterium]|nr:nucleotidyltransferase family protein [Acidimicrobiia bacterium]